MRRNTSLTFQAVSTAVVLGMATLGINPQTARADHHHDQCANPALLRQARQLERAAADLAEGVEEHYAGHPWYVRLVQETQTLVNLSRRFTLTAATNPAPQFLQIEIQNVCDQFQRTERLLRAIGLPGCVRTDLKQVEVMIERLERDLTPVRIQPYPQVPVNPGNVVPQPINPPYGNPNPYGYPLQGGRFDQIPNGQYAPVPGQPGFPQQPGVIVPSPAPSAGPVLQQPIPQDRYPTSRHGQPLQLGVQVGNVRFSVPIR